MNHLRYRVFDSQEDVTFSDPSLIILWFICIWFISDHYRNKSVSSISTILIQPSGHTLKWKEYNEMAFMWTHIYLSSVLNEWILTIGKTAYITDIQFTSSIVIVGGNMDQYPTFWERNRDKTRWSKIRVVLEQVSGVGNCLDVPLHPTKFKRESKTPVSGKIFIICILYLLL